MPEIKKFVNQVENTTKDQSKGKFSKVKVALMIVGSLTTLFIIWWVFLLVTGIFSLPGKSQQIEPIVLELIEVIQKDDIRAAYELSSSEVKNQFPYKDWEQAINGFKDLFIGINNVEQSGIYFSKEFNGKTYYEYRALTEYDDGKTGDINITVVKESGDWKIHNIDLGKKN